MLRPENPIWLEQALATGGSPVQPEAICRLKRQAKTGSTMQDSFDVTTLIFLGLAVFVIWRLRSVLGQKTGHEQPPFDPISRRDPPAGRPVPEAEGDNVVRLPGAAAERGALGRRAARGPRGARHHLHGAHPRPPGAPRPRGKQAA